MAVGVLTDWSNFSEQDYDRVTETMRTQQDPPKGCLFHTCGGTTGGLRVFDVWESREAFENFLRGRLDPALQQLGLANRVTPRSEFFNIHAAIADGEALNNLRPAMSRGR
jgi:hypothetical protein